MGYLQPEGVVERRTRKAELGIHLRNLHHYWVTKGGDESKRMGLKVPATPKLRIVRFLRNSDSHQFLIVRSDRYFRMISNPFGAGG